MNIGPLRGLRDGAEKGSPSHSVRLDLKKGQNCIDNF